MPRPRAPGPPGAAEALHVDLQRRPERGAGDDRARNGEQLRARTRATLAENLPLFEAFFAEWEELFEWEPPAGGCVCFPRYLGDDGVEAFCRALLEEAGVVLLPAGIFASALADIPADRFRIGLGRRNPEPALAAFGEFLRAR